MALRLIAGAALSAVVALGAAAAETGTSAPVRLLGHPCLSFNVLGGLVTKDPTSGNDLALMANTNEKGGELLLVDLDTMKGDRIDAPSGMGGWALTELPGGRIAYGTFYDGHIMIFDLKSRKWIKDIDVEGEKYLWNFTRGADGRLYGGTYSGGKLVSMDVDTYEIKDHGSGGAPNLYARFVSSLPDRRIVIRYSTEKPVIMVYDPNNDSYTTAPDTMQGMKNGVAWEDLFVTAEKAFDSTTLEQVEWPFKVLTGSGETTAPAQMELSTSGSVYLAYKGDIYRVEGKGKPAKLIPGQSFHGTKYLGVTDEDRVVGVRGQELVITDPDEGSAIMEPIPVKPKPRPPLFLTSDNSGQLWGGPEFGQNVFVMNPDSGETTNTQVVTYHGGEVYDMDFQDGIAYMVSYSGGEIIRYDPAQPWNEIGKVNPKRVHALDKHKYIRPAAGCTFGPDGKLYSGWWIGYGRYGGCIAITDVKTGDYRLIENPLGEQGVSGLDVDDRYAYVATAIHGNGLPVMKDKAPQFGMVNLESGEAVFRYEFEDYNEESTTQSTPLIVEEQTGRVAVSKDGRPVKIFDPNARAFVLETETAKSPGATSFVMASMHNGKVVYGAKHDVVELDMTTGKSRILATLPEEVFAITADPAGIVYASAGTGVYEINLIPQDEDRD